MPKPTGATQKGRVTLWLRQHPGRHCVKNVAQKLHVSRASVYAALTEARANGWAEMWAMGKNTCWRVWLLKEPNEAARE